MSRQDPIAVPLTQREEFYPIKNSVGAALENQIDQVGLLDDSGVVDVALVQDLEELLGMHVHKFLARVVDRWQDRG